MNHENDWITVYLFTPGLLITDGPGKCSTFYAYLLCIFNTNVALMMNKIKVKQSAMTSYFAVQNWTGGYGGIQQTPDTKYATSNIFIASQWNPNEAAGIYSGVDYIGPGTTSESFGGEGTGSKTTNDQIKWAKDRWYNMVSRSYKKGENLNIAVFFHDLTNNKWTHMSTLSRPFAGSNYLGTGDDAFLENWNGNGAANDGRNLRKAFFKDCWGLTVDGDWVKPQSQYSVANGGQADVNRNGVYHWSFNAGYDVTEDAYFMEHGGNITRSAEYGGGSNRTLILRDQLGQGDQPVLTVGEVTSFAARWVGQIATLQWTISESKSPQWITSVNIVNSSGVEVYNQADTIPQQRKIVFGADYPDGQYTAKIRMTDIFGQKAEEKSVVFNVASGPVQYVLIRNVSSGKYLGAENASVDDQANIVQNKLNNSFNQQWAIRGNAGQYRITNRNSGKVIEIKGGNQAALTNVVQGEIDDHAYQLWNILSVGNDRYVIQSTMSGQRVIDNPGSSTAENTRMIIYNRSGSLGTPNQQWEMLDPNTLPDFVPRISVTPSIIHGNTTVEILVSVLEVSNRGGSNGELVVRVRRNNKFSEASFFYNPSQTISQSGLSVQNSIWRVELNDPNYYVFKTNSIIPKNSQRRLAFTIQLQPGGTNGVLSLLGSISSDNVGNEYNFLNNNDDEEINFFDQ